MTVRPYSALLAALLLVAGAASAQGVPATGGGAAKGGPALVAPAANAQSPQSTPPATQQGQPPAAPLPGQSTLGQPLPPLNANGIGGNAPAAAARAPSSITRSDTAITAFQSLDGMNRGYVTRAETDRIPGFVGFDNADANRDGQLTKEEFANAWKFYGGQ